MVPPASKRAQADKILGKSLASSGLRNTLHGNVFQLRLLMLFLTRGLRMNYNFKLDTEMPGKGGKFDDLIFTYKNRESKRITRYLQAKHKFDDSTKIKASDLLNESDGDFSLKKYFRSYREIFKTLGDNEELNDCIIGTNIGFDENDLMLNGIELVSLKNRDPILAFNSKQKSGSTIPVRYKLQIMQGMTNLYEKLEETSDMHCLAHELLKYGNKKQKLELRCDMFKRYHFVLVQEKVLDLSSKTFHPNFIDNVKDLSPNAKKFRKILSDCQGGSDWNTMKFELSKNFGKRQNEQSELTSDPVNKEEIENFLDKLVFAVNLPNEKQLDCIIRTEMGIDFNVLDSRAVSNELLIKLLNWFKEKSATTLSSAKAKLLLKQTKEMMKSLRATGASIDYRNRLCKYMKFNQDAIDNMTEKLKPFLYLPTLHKKVLRIATDSPKCTAIKIVQSLKQLSDFKKDDSYLIVQSKNLREEREIVRMRNILRAKRLHYLLVVVCNDNDTEQKWQELIPDNRKSKRIIIVETNIGKASMQDKFCFRDLNRKTKEKLQSKCVQFQGSQMKVETLLDKSFELNAIINLTSFQELRSGTIVKIPAPITPLSPELTPLSPEFPYIERQLEFSSYHENFHNQLAQKLGKSLEQLTQECRIDPALLGSIEWFVSDNERLNIWNKMKEILKENRTLASTVIRQENHFVDKDWKSQIMIISSVAGTGKSTILFHYFNVIKCNSPDHWVIKIDLVRHTKAISGTTSFDRKKAIKFLLQLPCITGTSSFARSMLKHRLKVAGRVVLMLDGFDEISSACQDSIIQFIKAISQTKLERLYITTRPHLKSKLEDQLFQFAFHLQNFSQNDQVNYLTTLWKAKLKINDPHKVQTIQKFANSLVCRIAETLKDKERDFIGIPLQCRILAECYQLELENVINNGISSESDFLDANIKFSLSELYHRFMETKRQIFRKEKVKNAWGVDCITDDSIQQSLQTIATRLTGLAIETIFTNPEDVKLLWQDPATNHLSEEERELDEKKLAELCIRHGLVNENDEGGLQFLHRTFAEYLVAVFLFKGFNLDDRQQSKLLDSMAVSGFIVNDILAKVEYEGVRVFFDCMLREIVVEKEKEWQDMINESRRTLNPKRLQKFALGFSQTDGANWIASTSKLDDMDYPPLSDLQSWFDKVEHRYVGILFKDKHMTSKALPVSIAEGNVNIFKVLWGCLKATNEKQDVQKIACNLMADSDCTFGSTDIFTDLLDILEDVNDKILETLFCEWSPYGILSHKSKLNHTEQKMAIQCMFRFMEKHQDTFRKIILHEFPTSLYTLIDCCMEQDFLAEELKKLLHMLSRHCEVDQDNANLFTLIKSTVSHDKIKWNDDSLIFDERTENLLIMLREIGRADILSELSYPVLQMKPKSFQRIYYPIQVEFPVLTTKNSYGMTLFHQAAAQGDATTVKQLLNLPEETHHLVDCMTSYDGNQPSSFTPFLVALCCDHKEVCELMLQYLKRVLPFDELCELIKKSGFFGAVDFAISERRSEMYHLILEIVKDILGQATLIDLLKYVYQVPGDMDSDLALSRYRGNSGDFLKAVVKNIDGYEDLADLVSQDKGTLKLFQNITDDNIINKLICLKGSTFWIERFIAMGIEGFDMLMSTLLEKLNKDGLSYTIEMITLVTQSGSIWSNYVNWARWTDDTIKLFLGRVANQLGQNYVMKLVFHDDGNGPVIIRAALRKIPTKNGYPVAAMVAHVTERERREEIRNLINSSVTDFLQKFTIWVLCFIQDFSRNDLLNLIKAITSVDNDSFRTGSVWSRYVDDQFYPSQIDKFLKCVSEELGEEEVINLLLHDGGKGPVIVRATLSRHHAKLKTMYSYLSASGNSKVRQAFGSIKT